MLKAILLFSCLCSSIYVISSDSKKLREKNKYILLWSHTRYPPFTSSEKGQESFIRRHCPINNCYVTTNRSLLNGDITNFDVIAFMGWNLKPHNLPEKRSPHQRYLFVNHESRYYSVLDPVFDGFFNWTATFKLNSDIPIPYVHIQDKRGNEIGPKKKMDWSAVLNDTENVIDYPLGNKSKAAAIFLSNCGSKKRNSAYRMLNKNLKTYNLSVDVYGKCGTLKCKKNNKTCKCDRLLKARYYFYLAFENSFDKDYVTEKLLRPLMFNVVPVVFGGANYSRFLPPGSYLDARALSSSALAKTMAELIRSPESYKQYFKWQRHYTYQNARIKKNVCKICAKVNDPSLLATHKVYHKFRNWWHRY